MKTILFAFIFLLSFLIVSALPQAKVISPVWQIKKPATVIYLVRHAEKNTTDPDDTDPDLTPAGYARAQALERYLKNIPVDAFLSSPYKRTRMTLKPLAGDRQIIIYQAHGYNALRQLIMQKYTGKTVVIVGHSNTLLDIIETFGGTKPTPAIADKKYDYIFKVTLRPGKKAKVETATYGTPTS